MKIRKYLKNDEKDWLQCRLLSFFDTSYYDNIVRKKENYDNNAINLVAIEDNKIIGFIDVEIEKIKKQACYLEGKLGGVIWELGVLPEYRNKKTATRLLERAITLAKAKNICRFEAWTQDDIPINYWYKKHNFQYKEGYLNVFADQGKLVSDEIGKILGVRIVNFEASLDRKDELVKKYKRVHEVRVYELKFDE